MAYPLQPSCQVGQLHATLSQHFEAACAQGRLQLHDHPLHWEVPVRHAGMGLVDHFLNFRFNAEELYFLLLLHDEPQWRSQLPALLRRYNRNQPAAQRITMALLARISCATDEALRSTVQPLLRQPGLHLMGFSTSFAQVFASIHTWRWLRRHSRATMLPLFGGASMSMPQASYTLHRWGVRGLVVMGTGEGPLTRLLTAALQAESGLTHTQRMQRLREAAGRNTYAVGQRPPKLDLRLDAETGPSQLAPEYRPYFAALRRHCQDEQTFRALVQGHVALPLEASRGCFARCDFCQVPNITTAFSAQDGSTVAQRVLQLCERHGRDDVIFADAVCDTWAEDYADALIQQGRRIRAFMELRVHHPMGFWVKLAQAGVHEVQLGVEAVSQPLLSAMNKGTTVIQNVRATKLVAELGLRSMSNLITHHPKSTEADVAETQRVLAALGHLPPFALSRLLVSHDSPMYRELSPAQRTELEFGFDWLPPTWRARSFAKHLGYPYPAQWLGSALCQAWDDFTAWHEARQAPARALSLTQRRLPDTAQGEPVLDLVDQRGPRLQRWRLEGDEAALYLAAHEGLTLDQLASACGLEAAHVQALAEGLLARGLCLQLGHHLLSLAMRPRDELLALALPPRRQPRALRLHHASSPQ